MKNFNTLSEGEILALAISLEEDESVYADFAEGLKQDFPASASVFDAMRGDEHLGAHRAGEMCINWEEFVKSKEIRAKQHKLCDQPTIAGLEQA